MKKFYVIVARHGERWDYVQRDLGKGVEWITTNYHNRPWDPPLSPQGLLQARRLGHHLATHVLPEMGLPTMNIAACYSSPFLRCRQTACQVVDELLNHNNRNTTINTTSNGNLKVRIELGLTESLNESWYRSWALPDADGTWGFVPPSDKGPGNRRRHLHEFRPEDLHPASKRPVQDEILSWQHVAHPEPPKLLELLQDKDYPSSTAITKPYALFPKVLVESKKEQQEQMYQVILNHIHQNNNNKNGTANDVVVGQEENDKNVEKCQTILLLSHGGPVTHLYEKLTGNNWTVHGDSKYCCYSIYEGCHHDHPDAAAKQEKGGDETTTNNIVWKPLVVNQSQYLDDLWSDATANI